MLIDTLKYMNTSLNVVHKFRESLFYVGCFAFAFSFQLCLKEGKMFVLIFVLPDFSINNNKEIKHLTKCAQNVLNK